MPSTNRMYKYFITFSFTEQDDTCGQSNTIIGANKPFESIQDLRALEDSLATREGFKNVLLTNFVQVSDDELSDEELLGMINRGGMARVTTSESGEIVTEIINRVEDVKDGMIKEPAPVTEDEQGSLEA